MRLYHDIPESTGMENALKRAKQLQNLTYTPVKKLPTIYKKINADDSISLVENLEPEGVPIEGVIYSSVRRNEKYVGFNISPETFISAVANPDSVVYTDPIEGTGQNVHCFYGIVCSCFASYVHNLHYRTPCIKWPEIPGISEVDLSRLENIKLCDLVLDVKTHIGVITDIERDVDGKIHYITVTESALPKIRTTRFTPEEFRTAWIETGFKIYRNANLHSVTYAPIPFVHIDDDPDVEPFINKAIMLDRGNRANYLKGDEPVKISVFDERCTAVEVTWPDGTVAEFPATDGKVMLAPEQRGFYSACCVYPDGKSAPVQWCVVDLKLEIDKAVYEFGEPVTISFDSPSGDSVVAYQFSEAGTDRGRGSGWIDSLTSGTVTIPGATKPCKAVLIIVARNAFGDYASRRIPLEVTDRKAD